MIDINDSVLNDIRKSFIIPVKPKILDEIQAITQSPEPDLTELAQLVSQDVGISSAILKVINSPFYGMNRTISDIRQAVFILGINAVEALVTSLKLRTAFTEDCCISLELFWDNAAEIANTMVYIGNQARLKIPPENLYSLGLFHDGGIPAMACKYDNYVDVLDTANQSVSETIVEIEERHYPTNHAIVGYFLANSWHLPKSICQLILYHHDVSVLDRLTEDEQTQFCVLKMAENVVFHHKRNQAIPEWYEIKDQVMAHLLLDDDSYQDLVEDIRDVIL